MNSCIRRNSRLDEPMRRKLAALNANLTLSDIIFQEILEFEKRLNAELGHRREAFYRKIEEVADEPEAEAEKQDEAIEGTTQASGATIKEPPADKMPQSEIASTLAATQKPADAQGIESYRSFGMDGCFLAALEAHNKADFNQADAHLQ